MRAEFIANLTGVDPGFPVGGGGGGRPHKNIDVASGGPRAT